MPALTIIIPHKRTGLNDCALDCNITALLNHTRNNFELIIDTESPKDPYKIWNEAAARARSDTLVFTNSDVMMARDWDVMFLKYMQYNAIVTGYLVEPGTIGVAAVNIQKDFGRIPEQFDVVAFEQWADDFGANRPEVIEQRGWYMPCAVNRDWFLSTGGFNTEKPFPNPNDIIFWETCIAKYNTKLIRVRSFAYHFQYLSSR